MSICLSVCPLCLSVTFEHCGQTVARIKMKLGTYVGLGPGHIVLDGDRAPPPKRAQPQFSAHICCGQIAAWIKMSLGMELGLGPGDFVLDGDPASLPKRGQSPPPQLSAHFYCGKTAGCIKMPLVMEVSLSPGDFVLDGNPTLPFSRRGGAPNFLPTSIVAKRLHGSRYHLVWRYRPQPRLCYTGN